MSNDVAQVLFFSAAGAVGLLLAWYIFIKGPQQRSAALAPWAQKRGLAFTPPRSHGSHTIGHEVTVLEGNVQGVPVRIASSRLVNSPRAGIHGHTEVACQALAPAQVGFQLLLEPGPGVAAPDAVPTGDGQFDMRVRARSDNPGAARAWLDPAVRHALLTALTDGAPVRVVYAGGAISVTLPQPIAEEAQLDRALAVAHAAGYARLG